MSKSSNNSNVPGCSVSENIAKGIGNALNPRTCSKACQCFDHRYPSYTTTSPCPYTRQGFLPADSYMFTREGAVYNSCTGRTIPQDALWVKTRGPKYGATMGSCVAHAVQSNVLDYAGSYTPYGVMGYEPRGCFL